MAKKKPAKKATKKPAAKKAKAPAKKAAKKAAPKKVAAKKSAPKKMAKPTTKAAPKAASKPQPKAAPAISPKAARPGAVLEGLFTPLDDRLIVEASVDATRTAGGLYIPDTVGASDRPKQGKVVAVGRGHQDKKGRIRPLDVQLGDTVMFESFQGSQMKIGDRELVVLRESQVLGILK